MKQVLIEMEKLRNPNSGLGQFCLHLGQHFQSLHSESLQFHYHVPSNQAHRFPSGTIVPHSVFHKIFRPKTRYDLWHCLHQDSDYLPGNPQTKLIITIHDLNFLEKYRGLKRTFKLKKLQRKVDRAQAITVISHYTESVVRKNLNLGEKPLVVIPNGNPLVKFDHPQKPPFINFSGEFIFSIGIISPKKNFHVLLPLIVKNPLLHLVIAGDQSTTYAQEILDAARKLGVESRLHLPGTVGDEYRYWLYQNCKAFVFPSTTEGFGFPVVEAMSLGKPVFLSNLTSLPEVGGKEAYYWNQFDADHLQQVFQKGLQEFTSEKAQRSIQWAEQFSWATAARAYLKLYQEL